MKMHEEAFQQWGAVPEETLYDRMRTIWNDTKEHGEIISNPSCTSRATGVSARGCAGRTAPRRRARSSPE